MRISMLASGLALAGAAYGAWTLVRGLRKGQIYWSPLLEPRRAENPILFWIAFTFRAGLSLLLAVTTVVLVTLPK